SRRRRHSETGLSGTLFQFPSPFLFIAVAVPLMERSTRADSPCHILPFFIIFALGARRDWCKILLFRFISSYASDLQLDPVLNNENIRQ
ncbi:hypothetical protein PENTCL1PPCAC_7462, partial [Pristionchus entomophagus]